MQVPRHSRARRLAQVQAEVEAMRPVQLLQLPLRLLCQIHHFVGRIHRHFGDPVQMGVGHDHHVS